ncbi:iron chelate uptake ABC transporter family permease subunit [Streptomyces sp. NPDC127117]|uniref:iron chelate uptake ABC transporter family permease subunit n=1 Tax=Streptomyces sp. NPDC127117 TaxID=3345368 RepID=UPI0036292EFD
MAPPRGNSRDEANACLVSGRPTHGYGLSYITTFLLLRADPRSTPRNFTWLSGTTYGRSLPGVIPVAAAVSPAPRAARQVSPARSACRRRGPPRVVGGWPERTRFAALAIAAVLSVIAVGVVGFVGLVAPHFAWSLVGARHGRVIPVAMLLGGLLVCVAAPLGRTVVAPAQMPTGPMISLVGASYFIRVPRRPHA